MARLRRRHPRMHRYLGPSPPRLADFVDLPLGATFKLRKDGDEVYQKTTRASYAGPDRKRRRAANPATLVIYRHPDPTSLPPFTPKG